MCRKNFAYRIFAGWTMSMVLSVSTGFGAPRVDVEITGVEPAMVDALKEATALYRNRKDDALDSAAVNTFYKQSVRQLESALRSNGYYRALIKPTLESSEQGWIARYEIDLGPPVKYDRVKVSLVGEGEDRKPLQQAIQAFPIKAGDKLNHEVYERAKRELLRIGIDNGFIEARFVQHQIRIDMQSYSAALDLEMDTGSQFRFGELRLIQDQFKPEFLRKYVNIRQGEPYSNKKLLELQNIFRDSDYFSDVEVTPQPDRAVANEIPVDVTLEPRKPSEYTFGVGFGTDTGPRGTISWERRRINSVGHRLQGDIKVSEIGQSVTGRYIIPIRKPRHDRLTFFAGYSNDDPDNSDSETGSIGVARSTVHGQTRWGYSLTFQREAFTVGDVSDTVDMLLPGFSISRIKADDQVTPRKGMRLGLDIRGTHDALISDVSFLQIRGQAKLVRSFWKGGRVLLRADVGYTQASEVETLPASIRFFAGGDRSVRGYGFNDLGTRDDNGEVIGGRHLLVTSIEYEHSLSDQWSVATFFDAGNAFDDFDEQLEQGLGFGVRWKSPVGPIRVDIASAITEPDDPVRLHISIGPDL